MAMKKPLAIAVGIACLALLVAFGIVAGLYYAVRRGVSSGPADEPSARLVLGAPALEKYGVTLDPRCTKLTQSKAFGMMAEVRFEHDCEGAPVYVLSAAETHLTATEARQAYLLGIGGMRTGLAVGGGKLQPRRDLVAGLGDERYSALVMTVSGEPAGNIIVLRQGRIVHTFLITGVFFDDASVIRELFGPVLEESKARGSRKR